MSAEKTRGAVAYIRTGGHKASDPSADKRQIEAIKAFLEKVNRNRKEPIRVKGLNDL